MRACAQRLCSQSMHQRSLSVASCRPRTIRANTVASRVIDTDLWQDRGKEGIFKEQDPTGKVRQPEELAEAYLYCLKD